MSHGKLYLNRNGERIPFGDPLILPKEGLQVGDRVINTGMILREGNGRGTVAEVKGSRVTVRLDNGLTVYTCKENLEPFVLDAPVEEGKPMRYEAWVNGVKFLTVQSDSEGAYSIRSHDSDGPLSEYLDAFRRVEAHIEKYSLTPREDPEC